MRRLVAAAFVVVLALSLAGCGGGGEEEAATPTTDEAAAPVPAAPTAVSIPDRSTPESGTVFQPLPADAPVPATLKANLDEKQPTVLLFVDGSMRITNEVRAAVDDAIDENAGIVELVLFDIGKYASTDASGNAVVDSEGITANEQAAQAAVLARQIGVTTLPYLCLIDDQAHIVFRNKGLIDSDILQMHMERLTD